MDWIRYMGPGELMAISSAALAAMGHSFTRQGMRTSSPFMAALIANGMVCLGGLSFSLYRGTLQTLALTPFLWFMAMGIAGPGIGRISRFIGITKIGLNRSITISSVTPLWATMVAIVVLGESPTPLVVWGTLSIVGGVGLLSMREDKSQSFGAWFQGALIFPLVSSVGYALAPIFAKLAFAHQQTPMAGLAVGFAVGNLLLLCGKPLLPRPVKTTLLHRDIYWLISGGALYFLAAALLTASWVLAPVSTTMPLSRTAPIWVLLFSRLFLGKLEKITGRTVIATFMVVLGGILITSFRP